MWIYTKLLVSLLAFCSLVASCKPDGQSSDKIAESGGSVFPPIDYQEVIDSDGELIDLNNPEIKKGVFYVTTTAETRTVNSQQYGISNIPFTEMYYNSEGFNQTNVELSATTKEEYLFGITSSPTVFNDLFIDRGRATVIQSHMQLGEIKNMEDLINYGNGFYNL